MKNELITQTTQLPDTIEDLTQFVLVGKSKLNAYMLKLRTVNRLSVAQEIRNQTLEETQELANALIAAEQRIGELLLAIPKASGNQYTSAFSGDGEKAKSKAETINEMGYGKHEAADFQQMARNPDIVRKVIEYATSAGEVVTKSAVMKEIQRAKEEAKAEAQAEMKGFAETIKQQSRREAKQEVESELQALRQTNKVLKEQASQAATVVAPEDYQEMKQKAIAYDAEVARLNNKINQVYEEKRKLQDQIDDLKQVTQEGLETGNLSENVFYFCTLANNFVGNAGGLVWLTSRINDMSDRERSLFLKAAQALRDFSQVFTQNMERMEYGESDAVIGGRKLPSFPD